jgi:O-antigen/teichoic acid export membrane protein
VINSVSVKSNIIANYIGQIYSAGIGIVILPFYLKYLGLEAYGLVGFFTMLQAWIALLDLGLSPAMMREAARLKNSYGGLVELKILLRSIEVVFFILAFILIILTLSNSNEIAQSWLKINELTIEDVAHSIVLMGFMISLKLIVSLYRSTINGCEYQVWLNIFLVIVNTLKFAGGFIFVKYVSRDITHFFEYQMFIGVVELLIIQVKMYKLLPKSRNFISPSLVALKKILHFSSSVAFVAIIWVVATQIDKLLLSHFISLKEYAYFSLAVLVSGVILQLSGPVSQAIIPKMTSLLADNKEKLMLDLYNKATQFVAIISFSIAGTVAFFSTELLYVWTGDIEASKWAGPILFWYALGNGILTIFSFQSYLQFAYGKLKYYVYGGVIFGTFQILIVSIAVYTYSAIGAAIAWTIIQSILFLVWPAYIHKKFIPGMHKSWLKENIIPQFITTFVVLYLFTLLDISFYEFSRLKILIVLLSIGSTVLMGNIIVSQRARSLAIEMFK